MKLRFNFSATMLVWWWLSSAAVVVQEEQATRSAKRAVRKQRKEIFTLDYFTSHLISKFNFLFKNQLRM